VDPKAGLDDMEKRKFLTLPGRDLREFSSKTFSVRKEDPFPAVHVLNETTITRNDSHLLHHCSKDSYSVFCVTTLCTYYSARWLLTFRRKIFPSSV
jgi:hypothetical protein